jgi:EAL domain-containing protein (putative c-di-GMP-specific phosphodiesterase class I)
VLRTALADCAGWAHNGVVLGVNVNVSGRWLHDPGFPAAVRHALDEHPQLSPGRLKFEVVESAALADIAAVSSTMEACTAFGVEFALDDFGTGYSTLTYLKTLPASALKIDRSFIEHMIEDERAQSIVRGVIGLASGSGRKVVAEGVERETQALRLRELGCDFAQGYFYSPPQPAELMLAWLQSWHHG